MNHELEIKKLMERDEIGYYQAKAFIDAKYRVEQTVSTNEKLHKKIEIKIIKTSDRGARLIEACDGRQCWIKPSINVDNGTIDEKTFATAMAKAEAYKKETQKAFDSKKAYLNGYHAIPIVWRSDKAIGVDYEIQNVIHSQLNGVKRWRIFIPKSVLKEDKVPGWILVKKIEEQYDEIMTWYRHNSWIIKHDKYPVIGNAYILAGHGNHVD